MLVYLFAVIAAHLKDRMTTRTPLRGAAKVGFVVQSGPMYFAQHRLGWVLSCHPLRCRDDRQPSGRFGSVNGPYQPLIESIDAVVHV